MGLIKKLLGKELMGWTLDSNTEVYPITSTSAVFDNNNISLDDIIKQLKTNISNVGNTVISAGDTQLLVFTVAENDGEAALKLNRNEQSYPPKNFSTSTNLLLSGTLTVYMSSARKNGSNWLRWEDNYIWSTPVRIGGNTTSTTGADGNGFNYIYCRRAKDTNLAPNFNSSIITAEVIEEASKYNLGLEYDIATGRINKKTINNNSVDLWCDHPLGVTSAYPYEWVVAFKGNSTDGWECLTSPILWSKYGENGTDGDGIEYIFRVMPNGSEAPTLTAPYKGRNGEDGSVVEDKYYNITDTEYQEDDFIPEYWHDEPQEVDDLNSDLYVSIRKKKWLIDEEKSLWGLFSEPKLWGKYTVNNYTLTLDNDSVVIDDNTSNDAIEYATLCLLHVYRETEDLIYNSSYCIKVTASTSEELTKYLGIAVIDKVDNLDVTRKENPSEATNGFEYAFIADTTKGISFCLYKLNDSTVLPTNTFNVTFKADIYNKVTVEGEETLVLIGSATRVLTIQCVDINEGISYLLLVSPNSIPIYRDNEDSEYKFSNSPNIITVTAKSCTAKEVNDAVLYYYTSEDTKEEKTLFVTCNGYKGDTLVEGTCSKKSIDDSTTEVKGNIITFELSNAKKDIDRYLVDLYYVGSENTIYKVDTETIDFTIKGDIGKSNYIITLDNDTAIIDDLTVDNNTLKTITETNIKVYYGGEDVTDKVALSISTSNKKLPNELLTYLNTSNKKSYILLNQFITSTIRLLTKGNYYYSIDASINDVVIASKRFNFSILDITPDGTTYSLNITNDTWTYDGDTSRIVGNSNSIITVTAITAGTPSSLNFTATNNPSAISSTGLCIYYSGINVPNPSTSEASKTVTPNNIYTAGGYDIVLYYKGIKVDSEHIDCIKNGIKGALGPQGPQGPAGESISVQGLNAPVLCPKGEWTKNTFYCYNCDSSGKEDAEIRYTDIVYYSGDSYICVKKHTSNNSDSILPDYTSGNLCWEKLTNLGSIITDSMIANAIATKSLNATDVIITEPGNRSKIVAGMTSSAPSSTALNLGVTSSTLDNANNNGVRIWAGSSNKDDIITAPFRVYEDGTLVASKANIEGSVTTGNLKVKGSTTTSLDNLEPGEMYFTVWSSIKSYSISNLSDTTRNTLKDNDPVIVFKNTSGNFFVLNPLLLSKGDDFDWSYVNNWYDTLDDAANGTMSLSMYYSPTRKTYRVGGLNSAFINSEKYRIYKNDVNILWEFGSSVYQFVPAKLIIKYHFRSGGIISTEGFYIYIKDCYILNVGLKTLKWATRYYHKELLNAINGIHNIYTSNIRQIKFIDENDNIIENSTNEKGPINYISTISNSSSDTKIVNAITICYSGKYTDEDQVWFLQEIPFDSINTEVIERDDDNGDD